MNLHVYVNNVKDWFVAESMEELIELYKEYNVKNFELDVYDMDLNFTQVPDDKVMTINFDPFGPEDKEVMTAKEFADSNGKGFLASTEY